MHAIMTVLQFPPNESFKSLVNFESRYGTKTRRFSTSALMQLPNASKERLMLEASTSRVPWFSVREARSLPARSIKLNLPMAFSADRSCWMIICKIAWDREDVSFAFVASVVRLAFPAWSSHVARQRGQTKNHDPRTLCILVGGLLFLCPPILRLAGAVPSRCHHGQHHNTNPTSSSTSLKHQLCCCTE